MKITPGSTDVTTYFVLRLTADGIEATGLTVTNFDLQYVRTRTAPVAKVDASALAATDSSHADNSAIEIDATDQPGLYRVDWPDAAFAAGVPEVILTVKVATCFTEHLRVELETLQTGDSFARLGAPAGASASADIAAVKAQTAAIETDTQDIQARLPAALTGAGNIKSDALAISGSTESADRLERSTLAIVTGTCAAGSSTTAIVASALSPTSAVNDQFNGRIVTFDKDTTTAALRGQSTDITDYVHATLTFTVTALTTAAASGDTFTIT